MRYCPRYLKGHTCTNSSHSYAIINTSMNVHRWGAEGYKSGQCNRPQWAVLQSSSSCCTLTNTTKGAGSSHRSCQTENWKKGVKWMADESVCSRISFYTEAAVASPPEYCSIHNDGCRWNYCNSRPQRNQSVIKWSRFYHCFCGVLWQLIVTATLLSASTVHCRAAMWVRAKEDS